jgi:hypothetical protein
MPKFIEKLKPKQVESIKEPGRHADGGNLYLVVSKSGARSWAFFYEHQSRQHELGLGRAGKGGVSLADARAKAAEGRALLKAGKNPKVEWANPTTPGVPTFGEVADAYIAAHEASWRNEKHRAQWISTLKTYCGPIRDAPVNAVDTAAVLSVLKPIWTRAPETASRLRGRIETVLDAARALGHIHEDKANPARWRGHLDKLLPRKPEGDHYAAMDYSEVPAFIAA